ncbi:uncharacterized protein yc1106_04822 [Curvularia clavata]|uniref:Uncharacterized protein n=1 Tax=Curvularia clavata TaxID=95742 RepID=A0A9Q8ZB52_CURCL|nr:uncharacterized protein yc1106_04822 [Curvularia clavata]
MNLQHWLVAHRQTETAPTVPIESQEEDGQDTEALVVPRSHPANRPRPEHTSWMQENLAEVYGYASLSEMHFRITSSTVWYDFEVEDTTGRDLSPWETQQAIHSHAGTLVHGQVEDVTSDSSSGLSEYESMEDSDEDYSLYSGPEIRVNGTPSIEYGSDRIDTPSTAGESYNGHTQLMLQAPHLAHYSIEVHTVVLYQDLMSLFRHHTDTHGQTASMLANTEMELLMNRYEASLAYFEHTISTTPAYLYSGISERIKQSIVYSAYIASDRAYFPTSPFSAMPWSYLGPKTYLASRLKSQRISSDMLMVFQNKRAVLREFKDVLWGRRRYLRWVERYPEEVARAMWMLDPTFTHTRVGLIDSLVERLEE